MTGPLLSRRRFLAASGAVLVAGPSLAACSPDREDVKRLAFLNWQDYIAAGLLVSFTEDSGVDVTYDTYESNDDLAKRVEQASRTRRGGRTGSSFDLIVPSDNFVRRFKDGELIDELDLDQIPNLDNLAPEFRDLDVDPGNRHTVPWATGTTGIGYLASEFDEPPGYDVFLDPEYEGRVTILDETRDAFAAALFSLGEDPNTSDRTVIDAAADRLAEMGTVAAFDSSNYLARLASGDLVAVQGYSTDVLQAREANADVVFWLPEQGALRWVDLMAVPTDAAHTENVYAFIDFYLRPEIAAANSASVLVDTGNAAARELLPQDLLDDDAVFPPDDVLDRLAFTDDLGEDTESYYEDKFTDLKG